MAKGPWNVYQFDFQIKNIKIVILSSISKYLVFLKSSSKQEKFFGVERIFFYFNVCWV